MSTSPGRERLDRVRGEEVLHGQRHRVDVAGRARHRLRDHVAAPVEDAGGEVARLAHDRGEGRAHERGRLLVDDADQPVPADVEGDGIHHGLALRWVGAHRRRRAITQVSCSGQRGVRLLHPRRVVGERGPALGLVRWPAATIWRPRLSIIMPPHAGDAEEVGLARADRGDCGDHADVGRGRPPRRPGGQAPGEGVVERSRGAPVEEGRVEARPRRGRRRPARPRCGRSRAATTRPPGTTRAATMAGTARVGVGRSTAARASALRASNSPSQPLVADVAHVEGRGWAPRRAGWPPRRREPSRG